MPLSTTSRNVALNALRGTAPASIIGFASLHTADPGTTGANELTGGSPAYARKAISFAAASAGAMAMTGTAPKFDVRSGVTITHVGFWTAATGGTFMGSGTLSSPSSFTAQGTYTLSAATISTT